MVACQRAHRSFEHEHLRALDVNLHDVNPRHTGVFDDIVERPRTDVIRGDGLTALRCVGLRERGLPRVDARRGEQVQRGLGIRTRDGLHADDGGTARADVILELVHRRRVGFDGDDMAACPHRGRRFE